MVLIISYVPRLILCRIYIHIYQLMKTYSSLLLNPLRYIYINYMYIYIYGMHKQKNLACARNCSFFCGNEGIKVRVAFLNKSVKLCNRANCVHTTVLCMLLQTQQVWMLLCTLSHFRVIIQFFELLSNKSNTTHCY